MTVLGEEISLTSHQSNTGISQADRRRRRVNKDSGKKRDTDRPEPERAENRTLGEMYETGHRYLIGSSKPRDLAETELTWSSDFLSGPFYPSLHLP